MDEPLQYNSTAFLNDPTTRLSSTRRSKYGDWNEYQRMAKFNPVEMKLRAHDREETDSEDEYDEENNEYLGISEMMSSYRPPSQTPRLLRRLASVKTTIYNPALPTFRRIDRDDAMCKLTDTHSRHNSSLPLRTFKNNQALLNISRDRQHSYQEPVEYNEQLYSIPVNMNHNRVLNRCQSVCVFRPSKTDRQPWFGNDKQRLEKFELIKSDYMTYKRKARASLIV